MILFLVVAGLWLYPLNKPKPIWFLFSNPPSKAEIVAPGVISDGLGNRDMAISPARDEFFYTNQFRNGQGFSVIMHSKLTKGQWSKPEVAPF